MPQMVDELPIARAARLRAVALAVDEGRAKAQESQGQG
jgi:hypothetical protein